MNIKADCSSLSNSRHSMKENHKIVDITHLRDLIYEKGQDVHPQISLWCYTKTTNKYSFVTFQHTSPPFVRAKTWGPLPQAKVFISFLHRISIFFRNKYKQYVSPVPKQPASLLPRAYIILSFVTIKALSPYCPVSTRKQHCQSKYVREVKRNSLR